jgi:hypothetical protein
MAGQLLSTGSISFADTEGVTVAADYGFSASTQATDITGDDQWKNPTTATPIEDLIEAKNTLKLGEIVAYMTQATWRKLCAATATKNAVYSEAPQIVRESDVQTYLATWGITVFIVDTGLESITYKNANSDTEYAFFPDNVVSCAPRATLGNMIFAPTPEEADLRAGIGDVSNIAIVDTGVAVVSGISYGPPVRPFTVVSQVVLPSFERVNKLHILNTEAGD